MVKLFRKFCAFLLPILGFTSCDFLSLRAEYGTPNADFEIKGKVTDTNNKPIKGIQVYHPDSFVSDTVYTEADGTFEISFNTFPPTNDEINLTFADIDGTENGEYVDKTESIALTQTTDSKDSWYHGQYSAEDVIVKMDEK